MRPTFLLTLAAFGCGSTDSTTSPDLVSAAVSDFAVAGAAPDFAGVDLTGVDLTTVPPDLANSGDLARSLTYPAGPYGNKVGDTFPPLVWEGYVDDAADAVATTKPFGAYTMNDARLSGRAYAMVHVSDFG